MLTFEITKAESVLADGTNINMPACPRMKPAMPQVTLTTQRDSHARPTELQACSLTTEPGWLICGVFQIRLWQAL